MRMVKGWFLLASLFLMFTGSDLWAGGLYLNEFGTPVMGNAGAGSSAEARDASTAFHNAAGMVRLSRPELMITGELGYTRVKFRSDGTTGISGDNGGNAGGLIPLMGFYYVHPINEDWRFGCNLTTLAGAGLDYGTGWTGRYQCDKVQIMTVTLMPSVAYRVNDWLSVAGGPTIMFGNLQLDASVNRGPLPDGEASLDGNDTVLGFSLSSLMQVNERTRLGIVYISEHELDFSGDLKFRPSGINFGADTTLPFAQLVRASVYHDLDDTWSVVGSLGWEDWSTMDNVQIAGASGGVDIPRNWDDTWHYAAGVHYRMDEQWTFRTGIAYDTSPVSAEDRTADMPIDRQVRYAVGANYQWTEDLAVGGSFVFADLGNARIKDATLSGEYSKDQMYMLGVYANWSF